MKKNLTLALAMTLSALAFAAFGVAGADWWPDPWWLAGIAALLCPVLAMAALAVFIRWDDMRDDASTPPAEPRRMSAKQPERRHDAVIWFDFH